MKIDAGLRRRALVILALALAAAWASHVLRPTGRLADRLGPIALEAIVPKQLGNWRVAETEATVIVDPQLDDAVRRIYTEVLTRTYVDSRGYRIMLSMAYGEDQRDSLQVHYPEVCYPAQGFQINGRARGVIQMSSVTIPVTRLLTAMGNARLEPVTYWVVIGDEAVDSSLRKKVAELKHTLVNREVPDGLLVRISSIDRDARNAHSTHEVFAAELLAALPPSQFHRIAGTGQLRTTGRTTAASVP